MFPLVRTARRVALACWGVLQAATVAGAICITYGPPLPLRQEMAETDVTIVCEFIARASADDKNSDAFGDCTFRILETLKSHEAWRQVPAENGPQHVKILYYGDAPVGSRFVAFGIEPPDVTWGPPIQVDDRALAYVRALPKLPPKRVEQLAFFVDYFEDADPLLAGDARDEFSSASYAEMKELKERLPRAKLRDWIADRNIERARRRQYLRLLGICGEPEDVPGLEDLIRSNDGEVMMLDALIGCYVALHGEAAMPLIDELFLANPQADDVATWYAVAGLQFIRDEVRNVPPERIVQSLRLVLDRPKFADMVVGDLARAEDWSVLPRLVELFNSADELDKPLWLKEPIVGYLLKCPLPEARAHLEAFKKLDPEAVRRGKERWAAITKQAPK